MIVLWNSQCSVCDKCSFRLSVITVNDIFDSNTKNGFYVHRVCHSDHEIFSINYTVFIYFLPTFKIVSCLTLFWKGSGYFKVALVNNITNFKYHVVLTKIPDEGVQKTYIIA